MGLQTDVTNCVVATPVGGWVCETVPPTSMIDQYITINIMIYSVYIIYIYIIVHIL